MGEANSVPLSPLSFLARARRAFASKVAAVDADGYEVSYARIMESACFP
jgi:hypothetical protein